MFNSIRELLDTHGCVREGAHFFVLKSGRVACKYVDIDPLLTYPEAVKDIAFKFAEPRIFKGGVKPDVVAGPAIGGIPLVFLTALQFQQTPYPTPRTVFTEKDGDEFTLNRMGFAEAVNGKNVLIVEDIASTLKSALDTAKAIEAVGGNIIGIDLIWDRGGVCSLNTSFPINALVEESIDSWGPGEHPMWGEWPIVSDIGHPEKISNYQGGTIAIKE